MANKTDTSEAASPFGPWIMPLILLALVSACGGPHRGYHYSHWHGRRGYDGNGDYGYNVNVSGSRAEATHYRARAGRFYPYPGSADDPWGPYVQEASRRHGIPERWIREVMRQESGGRLQAPDGSLTTSWVGAMGLMQVMPGTYDMLRRRYGLGDDPYEPHDNIMAGAAYIREMSDRYGSPGFLAAYNAGPDRVDQYLAGRSALPAETRNYVARIAPRLGTEVASAGPLTTAAMTGSADIYATRPATGMNTAALNTTASGNPGTFGSYTYNENPAFAVSGRTAPPVAVAVAVAIADAAAGGADRDRAYAGGGMAGAAYYNPDRMALASTEAPPPPPAQYPAPAAENLAGPETGAEAPPEHASLPDPDPQPVYSPPASFTGAGQHPALPPPVPMEEGRSSALISTMSLPPPTPVAAPILQSAPRFAMAAAASTPHYRPVAAIAPAMPPFRRDGGAGGWAVQVGAYPNRSMAQDALHAAQFVLGSSVAGAQPVLVSVMHRGGTLYRARLMGLSTGTAASACNTLSRHGMSCFAAAPGT